MRRSQPSTSLTIMLAVLSSAAPLAMAQDRAQDGAGDGMAVRRLAKRAQTAVVALDHEVGVGGGFGQGLGENLLDGQARSTGFLISSEGHVVTHARFVQGKQRFELYFHGGVRGWARVQGIDPLNRTALLKLEDPAAVAARFGGTLPHLEWGDSTALSEGKTVFTLGNCFDSLRLDGQASFSQGVVTTLERSRLGVYRGPIVETDASVNPGSFGGPLLDATGRVVGVITRNVSTRRWLGAAVPAEQVRRGIERLKTGRPLAKGLLGVALEGTGGEAARDGLRVARVQADSGAARAGLTAGDLIVALDGERVYDTDDVARLLANLPSGASVRALVRRGKANLNLGILLGDGAELSTAARPDPTPTPTTDPDPTPTPSGEPRVSLGLRLEAMDEGPGLKVVGVRPDGSAAAAGVQEGDIVAALGRERIRTSEDLVRALSQFEPGQKTTLIVVRERRAVRLPITFNEPSAARPTPEAEPQPDPEPAKRPSLGVRVEARSEGPGLDVVEVRPHTPAAASGLRAGDVLLAWNGRALRDLDDLGRALTAFAEADSSTLLVLRGRERLSLTLPSLSGEAAPVPARPRLGVRVQPSSGVPGLEVVEVQPGSPAARAGVSTGDIIVALGRRQLRDLDDLSTALGEVAGQARVLLVVVRERQPRRLQLDLSAEPSEPTPTPQPSAGPGYLGVYLNQEGGTPGVGIDGAVAGSPADQAGLRSGDRILSVEGASVSSPRELVDALSQKRAGETVRLLVLRGRSRLGVSVTLGERAQATPPPTPEPAPKVGQAWLGASIKDTSAGIALVELAPNGPLAQAGLQPGDVLLSLEGLRLTSVEQFAGLFANCRPGQRVTFEVSRDGWSKAVTLTLVQRP